MPENLTKSYHLIRSNIKHLYIQIKDGEVIVKAPKYYTLDEIERIVKEKKKWIEKNLEKSVSKKELEPKYELEEFIKIVQTNVKELITITGLKPNRVRIREVKYAWGSCSSGKNITINKRLIAYNENVIRYVILHELCHLKYMNHSKKFWTLVETYMPDYKEAKKELKK